MVTIVKSFKDILCNSLVQLWLCPALVAVRVISDHISSLTSSNGHESLSRLNLPKSLPYKAFEEKVRNAL